MIARIQVRRDKESNWAANNPILTLGEIGYDTDTEKFKVGISNSSRWNDLPYELGQWRSDASGNISYGYASDGPAEGNVSINNDLFVGGDLTVKGTTTTINTEVATFKDDIIQLNLDVDDTGIYSGTLQSGFEVNRGNVPSIGLSSQKIYWDEADGPSGRWVIDTDLNVLGDIYSNGTALWRLNGNDIYFDNGYVAIGLDNPSSVLHIKDVAPIITLEDENNPAHIWNVGQNTDKFFINTETAADGSMFSILDDGRVGIGTDNPSAKLDITENSGGTQFRVGGTSSTGGQFQINNAGSDIYALFRGADSNDNKILLSSNGDSYFMGGDVGIGTTNPSSKLEIKPSGNDVIDMLSGPIDMLSCNDRFLVKSNGTTEINATIGQPVSHVMKISNTLGSSISGENGSTLLKLKHDVSEDGNFYQHYAAGGGGYTGINFGLGVSDSQDGSSSIYFTKGAGSSSLNEIVFRTSDNNRVLIDADGKVGIGTDGPSSKLHLNGSSGVFAKITSTSTDATAETGLVLERSGTNTDFRVLNNGVFRVQKASDASNWTDIMTITSAGIVDFLGDVTANGIKLGVWTPSGNDIYYSSGDVGIGTSTDTNYPNLTNVNRALTIYADENGGSNVAALELSGDVVSAPDQVIGQLSFHNQASNVGSKRVAQITAATNGPSTDDYDSRAGNLDFYTAHTNANLLRRMRIDSQGNVGIGTSQPQEKLDVNGNITATGNITSASDITLKENIELILDPIEKVKELSGYTFNKKGEDLRMVGLIAQEVEKVLPEAVHENQEGLKSLAYGNLVALLVECVKKQDERIESLERTIKEMK